jgi:hypothetical protein
MDRRAFSIGLAGLLAGGCRQQVAKAPVAGTSGTTRTSVKSDLVFLTRDGCVNTPDMVNNLDDALKALRWPNDYQYINIGKLAQTDARTGLSDAHGALQGQGYFRDAHADAALP